MVYSKAYLVGQTGCKFAIRSVKSPYVAEVIGDFCGVRVG